MDRVWGSFVWNVEKERINVRKHGIHFEAATRAFLDPKRKLYTNPVHSLKEERFFCLGKVEGQVLTVRFTYRGEKIRIIGAGYWRKGRKYYDAEED